MSPELASALEKARNHVMTPAERFEQLVSFVYGQQDYDNPCRWTKDQVRAHLTAQYGYPETPAQLEGWQEPLRQMEG